MPAPLLIVGQGLAGTLFGWECERAGLAFEIVDAGHAAAASRVGVGIINPVTGQRFVKSWRIDAWSPLALAAYRSIEEALGVPIVQPMRIWREFTKPGEREALQQKLAKGELLPYVEKADADGFWIADAARVDTARLIAAFRERWRKRGCLCEKTFSWREARVERDLTILCTGAGQEFAEAFSFVPLTPAKGEVLTIRTATPHEIGVIRNRGHWLLPTSSTEAKLGTTYQRGINDLQTTPAARQELERAGAMLARGAFEVIGHEAGVRMTTPDRRPVIGRHPADPRLGVFGGLGSKGALMAPALAHKWIKHLVSRDRFDPEVDVARFMTSK